MLPELTQASNAKLLVEMFGSQIRYCYLSKKWSVYDGARWREDNVGVMGRAAKQAVQELRDRAGDEPNDERAKEVLKWARKCQSAAQQEAMLKLACSEPGIPVLPEDFDRDPWVIGLPNGTLDLRTRTFRQSRPEDLISKVCGVSYDPNAKCPNWEAFLRTVLPSPEIRQYLQKVFGVCLTGDTSDQSFYILHGTGANGKTTLVQTCAAVLADYALATPTSTFLGRRDGGVPNDLARLRGARFVYAAEPDVSLPLAEALLKLLTGGEPITARFLFAEFFHFYPEFKLFILANHLPDIESGGEATWRRIHLIPFTETIPVQQREKHFKEQKLLPELAGILNWVLEGLAMWQADGLEEPDEIRSATAEYRRECDVMEGFFQECVVADPDSTVTKQALHTAWGQYQFYNQDLPRLSIQRLARMVKARGVRDGSTGQSRIWKGIRLKDPAPDSELTGLTTLTPSP